MLLGVLALIFITPFWLISLFFRNQDNPTVALIYVWLMLIAMWGTLIASWISPNF